jgi:DNA-binding XRE family transcriptional regulator
MAKQHCRVRRYRKSAQLSQRELARLIGLRSQGVVSEIEAGLKRPSLLVALASSLIFDAPLFDLYPAYQMKARRLAMRGALELHGKIAADGERSELLAYLTAAIDRLGGSHSPL